MRFQFPGWKVAGGDPWLQWNSCTSQYPHELPPGTPLFDPQVSSSERAMDDLQYFKWGTCAQVLGSKPYQTFTGEYMHLYELDAEYNRICLGNGAACETSGACRLSQSSILQ